MPADSQYTTGIEVTAVASNPPFTLADPSGVVVPPPSASNPLPVVSAALRLDNYEQIMTVLTTDPHVNPASRTVAAETTLATAASLRQLFVFATEQLRTLIMRHVLSDPHGRTFQGKKKNWDNVTSFPIPKGLSVAGTQILRPPKLITIPTASVPTPEPAEGTGTDGSTKDALGAAQLFSDDDIDESSVDVVTYFLRPTDLSSTQQVALRISRVWNAQKNHFHRCHHRLIYLPQPTALIRKLLDNLGLTAHPNVSIHALQMDLFPLEKDVISLEYDTAGKEVLEGTPSDLITTVARSILKLQDVVGTIPRIQAYGPLGEEIVRKLLHVTLDEYLANERTINDQWTAEDPAGSSPVVPGGDVTALVVMDRKVDAVTPMLTPLTYEGLLDDVVGIDCGFIKVNVNTINPDDDYDTDKAEKKKTDGTDETVALGLNGADTLYAEVRDQHVEKFGSFLQNQAKALQASHANFTSQGKKHDLSEIHQFVKQIPVFTQNLRSLTNHIHLAELVKRTSEEPTFRERWQLERSMLEGETCYDQLEEMVASQYPPLQVLRLLCLQSLCAGGIKSSRYDAIRRDIVQTYGYEYLFVLHNLEKAGLLSRREGLWMDTASPFQTLRKSLILINAEVDTVEPDDVSYVSSGYAPLSVRLLQASVKGWQNGDRQDILRELPGRFIDITQKCPPQDLATALKQQQKLVSLGALAQNSNAEDESAISTPATSSRKPTLIIFYVGGVTHMELAALRFLSKRPTFPYHIVCCTTKVVNGSVLLKSLSEA